jgi:glycosyltransferase involved in cell wall biosynthesis
MKKWPTEAAQSLVYLGDIRDAQGDHEYAVELWNRAIQTDCTRREPWLRLAQHYFHKGDHQRVACYAEAALTINWSNYYGNRSHDYEGRPHELLYWAYCWMKRPNEARIHWDQARQYSPEDGRILHDAKFFMELPKVSIVVPHVRGTRQKELEICLRAIRENANYPSYEVIVEDDELGAFNKGVAKTFNRGAEKAAGEYVMFLGDDCVPQPNFLTQAMLSLEGPINGLFKRGMVGLNDGVWCGKDLAPATHWLAHKDMLNYLPGAVFLHEDYFHLGCDDELTAWARMHGDFQWCELARIEHRNPVGDDVYKRVWDPERVRHDRALLQYRADQFNLQVGSIPDEESPAFNPMEKIAELEATVKAQAVRLEQIHNDNIKLTELKNKYGETFGFKPRL